MCDLRRHVDSGECIITMTDRHVHGYILTSSRVNESTDDISLCRGGAVVDLGVEVTQSLAGSCTICA